MESSVERELVGLKRCDLPRNVYRLKRKVMGQWVWFAVTSHGDTLGPYIRRPGESDAGVVALLIAALDATDPIKLTLV